MKVLKITAYCLIALYFIAIGGLYFLQDKMIFRAPNFDVLPVPSGQLELVEITTSDDEKLRSYFFPAKEGMPTVIVFHGNASAAIAMNNELTVFTKAGFGVLLAEYRGYVGSTGSPSQVGLYKDGLATFDFLKSRNVNNILVYGHSLGAAIAVYVGKNRDVNAIFLSAPFNSMASIVKNIYPWVPVSLLLKHPFFNDQLIANINAPIKIVHGDRDRTIPIEHGKALAKSAVTHIEFETIKGAGHNNLHKFGVTTKAVEFFDRHIAGSS